MKNQENKEIIYKYIAAYVARVSQFSFRYTDRKLYNFYFVLFSLFFSLFKQQFIMLKTFRPFNNLYSPMFNICMVKAHICTRGKIIQYICVCVKCIIQWHLHVFGFYSSILPFYLHTRSSSAFFYRRLSCFLFFCNFAVRQNYQPGEMYPCGTVFCI